MMSNKTVIRRYRFNTYQVEKLEKLKQFGRKESDFVRQAIDEKIYGVTIDLK